jgi:23S rRNA (uracil1939-C5)-methyltransferase
VSGALAFDLYAGAGVTTAALRRRFVHVDACEVDPAAAKRLGFEPLAAAAFLVAHADARPDLVVANPPRAGFDPATRAALLGLSTARLHVMSCNPRSLARDLDALAPAFEPVGVRAYDTLPQTPHVELVVHLRRR